MKFERVPIECYSGYRANERPTAFTFRGHRWEVARILDRWYEGGVEPGRPSLDYFKVQTAEGNVFLLRYNSLFDAWAVSEPSQKRM